jgi:hypothetical protein
MQYGGILYECENDPSGSVKGRESLNQLNDQQWRTQQFFPEGVQQIQLRTEGKENVDLGAVAP